MALKEMEKEKVTQAKVVEEEITVKKDEKKSHEGETVEVSVDNSMEEVLKWNTEGYVLVFSVSRFLELEEDVIDELSRENFKRYFIAKGQILQAERDSKVVGDPDYWDRIAKDPFGGNATNRMKKALRFRRGWHGCLKAPEQIEEAKADGYKPIRSLSKEQQKLVDDGKKTVEDFWGDEKGPIVYLGREDEPEAMAMEVPQYLFDQHMLAVGYESRGKHLSNKQNYFDSAREAGLKPWDAEGEAK